MTGSIVPEIPSSLRETADSLAARLASMEDPSSFGLEAAASLRARALTIEAGLGEEPTPGGAEEIEKALAERLPVFDAWAKDASLPVSSRLTAEIAAKKIRAALNHDLPSILQGR